MRSDLSTTLRFLGVVLKKYDSKNYSKSLWHCTTPPHYSFIHYLLFTVDMITTTSEDSTIATVNGMELRNVCVVQVYEAECSITSNQFLAPP